LHLDIGRFYCKKNFNAKYANKVYSYCLLREF